MTQHMGMMGFSDEEEKDDEEVVGHLQLLPPLNKTLGWTIKEFKNGERRGEGEDNPQATHNSSSLTSRCTIIRTSPFLQGMGRSC